MSPRPALLLATAVLLAGTAAAGTPSARCANGVAHASAVSPFPQADTPEAKLAALIQRHDEKRKEVFAAMQEAATDEEKNKIYTGLPGKDFAVEFRALAEEAKGTDTAAQAWMWVVRLSGSDRSQAWLAVETLLEEHVQSAALADLPGLLGGAKQVQGEARVVEALRALVAESPHEKVRAGALYTLGEVLLESAKAENQAEGRDCLAAVVAEYGALAYGRNSTYKAAAERHLYELDHLQKGMVAPDFETVDENGVAWKLSDYKGKVVIVDFWGFW